MSEGTREDEVEDNEHEDAQEKKVGSGDHCAPSIELVDAHPLEVRSEAFELVISAEEAACI